LLHDWRRRPNSLHVLGEQDEQWLSELRREIQNPADYLAGPLLRCLWLRSSDASDLILIGEHLTDDGRSLVERRCAILDPAR